MTSANVDELIPLKFNLGIRGALGRGRGEEMLAVEELETDDSVDDTVELRRFVVSPSLALIAVVVVVVVEVPNNHLANPAIMPNIWTILDPTQSVTNIHELPVIFTRKYESPAPAPMDRKHPSQPQPQQRFRIDEHDDELHFASSSSHSQSVRSKIDKCIDQCFLGCLAPGVCIFCFLVPAVLQNLLHWAYGSPKSQAEEGNAFRGLASYKDFILLVFGFMNSAIANNAGLYVIMVMIFLIAWLTSLFFITYWVVYCQMTLLGYQMSFMVVTGMILNMLFWLPPPPAMIQPHESWWTILWDVSFFGFDTAICWRLAIGFLVFWYIYRLYWKPQKMNLTWKIIFVVYGGIFFLFLFSSQQLHSLVILTSITFALMVDHLCDIFLKRTNVLLTNEDGTVLSAAQPMPTDSDDEKGVSDELELEQSIEPISSTTAATTTISSSTSSSSSSVV